MSILVVGQNGTIFFWGGGGGDNGTFKAQINGFRIVFNLWIEVTFAKSFNG